MGADDLCSPVDGFWPKRYVGGESVTFPNGLILKSGNKTRTGAATTVTFATPFPNGILTAPVAAGGTTGNQTQNVDSHSLTVNNFVIQCANAESDPYRWIVIGW